MQLSLKQCETKLRVVDRSIRVISSNEPADPLALAKLERALKKHVVIIGDYIEQDIHHLIKEKRDKWRG